MANARELVLKALYQIETKGAYLNQELKRLLDGEELLSADRGFATELLLGVVRNQLLLDYVIGQFSSVKLKKLSPWIHGILRLGAYQILKMERIPDSAACNEMVKLAGKYSQGKSRGFVNGVLRNISRKKDELSYPTDKTEALSVRYSCPLWLTKRLTAQYGETVCKKILEASLRPHPVFLRVNTLKITPQELMIRLQEEGIKALPMDEIYGCLRVEGALNIHRCPAYKEGLYTLQNPSSMVAVLALDPQKGDRVLDLCAAPGGKSTFAAELMENTGEIIACDLHEHKISLIEHAAKRLGISTIHPTVHDGTVRNPLWENGFDRVLADVPCSGIGVIHKKPDIKWKRKEEDIAVLCEIQKKILENAGRYVKNGGILVYSTCTILREENQEQIAKFLQKSPEFTLLEEQTLFTHEGGGSGFYIAKLCKVR